MLGSTADDEGLLRDVKLGSMLVMVVVHDDSLCCRDMALSILISNLGAQISFSTSAESWHSSQLSVTIL